MDADSQAAAIAAAIGEPARARMLFALMDGHARTSTELAVIAEVSPSTASAHLGKLVAARLVTMRAQGKHRYHALAGPQVAAVLEGLNVLAGRPQAEFRPSTPEPLRRARTCYDHLAGRVAVALHDALQAHGWLTGGYEVTEAGCAGFAEIGIETGELKRLRRRFACGCLDWSERRPHLGGALGAAVLDAALRRRWLVRDLDSRAVELTDDGAHALEQRFGIFA